MRAFCSHTLGLSMVFSIEPHMNKLPLPSASKFPMPCEGSSMRSISRCDDVTINTVTTLLVDAGSACLTIQDETVRNVSSKRVQCDEISRASPTRRTRTSGALRQLPWNLRCVDVDRD